MLHKSTQHATIGYVTDGSVTAFAAGRARMMRAVRQSGTARLVMVIGDRADIAETIGRIVGVDAAFSVSFSSRWVLRTGRWPLDCVGVCELRQEQAT